LVIVEEPFQQKSSTSGVRRPSKELSVQVVEGGAGGVKIISNVPGSDLEIRKAMQKFRVEIDETTNVVGVSDWRPEIELTGATDVENQKFIIINTCLKPRKKVSVVSEQEFGKFPVSMHFTFRKGIDSSSKNPTTIKLDSNGYQRMVQEGRRMLDVVRNDWLKNEYPNVASLPKHEPYLLEIRAFTVGSGVDRKQKTNNIMLTVSLIANSRKPDEYVVTFDIREYYEDARQKYTHSRRGVCLGLKAFMTLVGPVHEYVQFLHTTLLTVHAAFEDRELENKQLLERLERGEIVEEEEEDVEEEDEEEEDMEMGPESQLIDGDEFFN
jgi:hypothetical protein